MIWNLGLVTRTGIFPHIMSNDGERLFCGYTKKVDFAVDEGKDRPNPSRDKNEDKHRRRKVEKSCVTFFLCNPGWCVHKSVVQNKWDDNTTRSSSNINILVDGFFT